MPREGSFCLTPNERELLKKVTGLFKHTAVLINCGNTVNIKEILDYEIDALMLIWQGGQYGGKAVAQLLISVLSCFTLAIVSEIWGLVEGIMILCGKITTDGKGNALKD